MRNGEPVTPASAATTSSKGTPHHSAAPAAASAFGTCCTPCRASRTSAGAPRRGEAEPRAELAVEHHVPGAHLGVAVHRVPEHRAGAARRHAGDPRVVEVQDGDAGRRQRGDELALGAGNTVEVAEVLDVGHGDAGHDADLGPGHPGQPLDVAHATGAHLEHHPLRIVGSVEQRQGQAELVVEGALAGRGREGPGQAGTEEVLGGRLADRPGDPDHAVDAAPRQHAQVHERHRRVGDPDGRPAERRPHGQVGGGTGVERSSDEGMPVPVCDDRHVELPRRQGPGVDACAVHGDVGPDQLSAEVGCEFRCGESHALPSRPIV